MLLLLIHTFIHTFSVCIVLATEETTVTQRVSHRPIKCQSHSWSQRGKKVNESHHGDNPLLRPFQGSKSRQNPCQVQPPDNIGNLNYTGVKTMSFSLSLSLSLCVCVRVCVCCLPIYSGRQACGRTNRGHGGGRSHRISHPPSFCCGACLHFSREKDSVRCSFPSSTVKANLVY